MRAIVPLCAATALLSILCTASEVEADGRTTLAVMDTDGAVSVLGVMMSQGICDSVARRLNFYADLPPADPVRFYCRSPY